MRIETRMGEWTQEVESHSNAFGQTCWKWHVRRTLPEGVLMGVTAGSSEGHASRELAEASAKRFMDTDGRDM
jgi:hypothetical protein